MCVFERWLGIGYCYRARDTGQRGLSLIVVKADSLMP